MESLFKFCLTQICGPTIPKKCLTVTTYNGMCFIHENNVFKPPIPSVLRGKYDNQQRFFSFLSTISFLSFDETLLQFTYTPASLYFPDCPDQIDIAFLLDGSGSVGAGNFVTMKTFVINMIKRFTDRDGQVQEAFNFTLML